MAHIPVIEAHLTEAPYIGVGFVLLAIAGIVLGVLLLTADTRLYGHARLPSPPSPYWATS